MAHQMGLVNIILGTKDIPTIRNYTAAGSQTADDTGMRYTDSGTTTVTASSSFDNSCKPYSSTGYWYIVKGNTMGNTFTKTFKSVSTVNTEWEYADVSVNQGNYLGITVCNDKIKRLCYKFTAVFDYTGTSQSFKLPVKGCMTMQCWGASGASIPIAEGNYPINTAGGKGGYVTGSINSIPRSTMLYIYVGGKGEILQAELAEKQTFNGGGGCRGFDTQYANIYADPHLSGQGGGATDIRFIKHRLGAWGYKNGEDTQEQYYIEDIGEVDESMHTRLLVAAGGGGANRYCYWLEPNTHYGDSEGGAAGGLIGYGGKTAACSNTRIDLATNTTGGTQTSGGDGWKYNGAYDYTNNGKFGYGGVWGSFGGGGGGYYGGGAGGSGSCVVGSGSGGSSYVSGHGGCVPLIYEGEAYTFSSPEIWDGQGYKWNSSSATANRGFPNTAGSGNENGHSGNGYAKIILTTPVDD